MPEKQAGKGLNAEKIFFIERNLLSAGDLILRGYF